MGVPHGRRGYDPPLYHWETCCVEQFSKLCLLSGIDVDINVLLTHLFPGCTECDANFERCESRTINHQYHTVRYCQWRITYVLAHFSLATAKHY